MEVGAGVGRGAALTELQRSVVIGTLLGDGAMRCKANALLEINHCAAQRALVDWKYAVLRDLVGTPPVARSGNGARRAYRFTTLSLPELTPFYRDFYGSGIKRVPDGLRLSARALAVWFMDDGSRSRSAVYFNTQQFDAASQERLRGMLWDQWQLETTLNRDKSYFRLRVAVVSMPLLARLIRPYLLASMAYKLPPALRGLGCGWYSRTFDQKP